MRYQENSIKWVGNDGKTRILEPGGYWYEVNKPKAQFIWKKNKWWKLEEPLC